MLLSQFEITHNSGGRLVTWATKLDIESSIWIFKFVLHILLTVIVPGLFLWWIRRSYVAFKAFVCEIGKNKTVDFEGFLEKDFLFLII